MDLLKAKQELADGNFTCVLRLGNRVFTSRQRGIAPLLEWLDGGEIPRGFSAADKAVGKAPACIYVLMGAKAVFAGIMTSSAIEIFQRFGIEYECVLEVPMIRNRTDTDFCPVELAVQSFSEPLEVINAARRRLEQMK